MKSLIWSVTIGVAVLAAFTVMPSDVFTQGMSDAAHAQRPAKADRECQDIVLPDGTVARCPSVERLTDRGHRPCEARRHHLSAPTRDNGAARCVLDATSFWTAIEPRLVHPVGLPGASAAAF